MDKNTKRLFGDQRIFQAVFNDLSNKNESNFRHEIVTLRDGTQTWGYVYDGVDPYELEDKDFPLVTKLITQVSNQKAIEARIDELKLMQGGDVEFQRYSESRISSLRSEQS